MISILYVDDEPDLLEIAKIFLEQSPDLHVDTFTSAKKALASPQFGSYDAIISDYQMPGMDGIAFLKSVREKNARIPFILFTGRGREDIVIEAINNGADFYLQKGGEPTSQFAELAHKVRQAVSRRRAEILLVESEKRQSEIIDFLPDATFAIDRDGVVIAWNRAIEEMTGIPAEEMIGKGDFAYAVPFYGTRRPILIDHVFKSDEEIARYYSNILRKGASITAETNLPHPRGVPITVLAKASPLYNQAGETAGAIESIRDITERKKADDELHAAYEQISASEEELREQIEALTASEQRVRESAARLRYMLGFYERAGGDEKTLMEYAVEGAGVVTGSPLGYLAFLNEDESELSMYAWSRSAMEECGLLEKPIVYKTEKTGLWGEAVRQRRPIVTNDYAAPDPHKKGYPEGHPVIVRHMNVPVIDEGRVVIIAGAANKAGDYTENDVQQLSLLVQGLWQVIRQRKIKEALSESEAKYRDLFENSVIGIFRTTPEGHFSTINRTFARIAGYDSPQQMMEEIHDIRTQLYVDPHDRDRFTTALVTDGFVKDFQARFYHRDGQEVWILINATTVRDATGDVQYYEGTIEDITQQKAVEEALAREQTFSDAVIESIPGLLYLYDSNGKLVRWNKAHETITGYTAEELDGMDLLAWYRGDDAAIRKISDGVARAFREGSATAEAELQTKDGRKIPFFFTARRLEIDGKAYFTGIGIDVTEQRRIQDDLRAAYEQIAASEEELREQLELLSESEKRIRDSEVKFRSVFENSNDALMLNEGDRLIDCNRQALEVFGYGSVSEMAEMNPADASPPRQPDGQDSRIAAEQHLRTAFTEGQDRFEWVHMRKDGSTFPAEVSLSTFTLGNTTYLQTSIRDISERKEAEAALRERDENYRNVVEFSPFGMHFYELLPDGDLIFTGANPAADTILSTDHSQLIGKRIEDAFPGLTGTEIPDQYRKVAAEGRVWHKDESFYDQGAIRGAYAVHAFRIRPGIMVAAFTDITERKRTEEALRQKTAELDRFFTTSLDLFCIADTNGYFRRMNPEWERALGYTPADLEGHRFLDLVHPDDLPATLDAISRLKGQEEILNFTNRYRHRDGSYRWIEWRSKPVGELIYAAARDVTHHRMTEDELRQSEEKYRSIIETMQDVFYRSDRDGNLVMASPSILPLLGYESLDELIGRNIATDIWQNRQEREAFLALLAKTGSVTNYDVTLRRRDGSPVTVATSSHYYPDRYGNPDGVEGIFHDVTSVRKADEQRELLAGLLDLSPASITVHDYNGRFLYANERTFDLHGYTRDEFMAMRLPQLDVPESSEHIAERIDELRRNGEASFDVEHFRKDGTRIPLHIVIRSIHWDSYDAILSVATAINRESLGGSLSCNGNTLCNCIVDNSHDIIYMLSPGGTITFISPSWTSTLGHSPAEVVGQNFSQFIVPEDLPGCREFLQRTLESGVVPPGHEYRVYHKDGSVHWYQTTLKPVYDEDGAVMTLVGNAVDITDRLTTEQALRESEARYRSVIENIQDAFIRVNTRGEITMASPSAARMFGYGTESAMIGRPVAGIYDDSSGRDAVRARIDRAGSVTDLAVRFRRADGSAFFGSLNARLVRDRNGIVTGTDKIIHDITDRHAMEEALREVNKKLALLNTITHHDVANQLVALQGFVQIASMMKTDPVIHDYLAKIHGVADTITRQIEFTKTYQDLGIARPVWAPIEEIVSRTASRVPVKFSKTCGGIEVFADPMLELVFFNLFDNAARHGTGVSRITVRCEREPDGILIIVEDDGAGIPLAEKEKIFTRGYGKNTGLGLFLAKEILAITGIGIRETGVPGSGARFEMLVPKTSCRSAYRPDPSGQK